MKQIVDIDNLIERQKAFVRENATIEIEDRYSAESIFMILSEIYAEAEKLPDVSDGMSIASAAEKKAAVESVATKSTAGFAKLKAIDEKLQRNAFYRRKIRPYVKNKASFYINSKAVDGRKLLQYHEEEFVYVLYRSLLGRDPDAEGLHNCRVQLLRPTTDRIDLIVAMEDSEEAKKRKIRVSGLCRKKAVLKVKRGILRIPLVGYLLKVMLNVLLLPKRIRDLQIRINELDYYRLRVTEKNMEVVDWTARDARAGVHMLGTQFNDMQTRINTQFRTIGTEATLLDQRIGAVEEENQEIRRAEKEKESKLLLLQQKEKELIDKIYLDYKEILMRSDYEDVKKERLPYLDLLNEWAKNRQKEDLKVIDLGCGFGEWVDLLLENNYRPLGVDSNDAILNKMITERNLPMVNCDAMTYLRDSASESIDVLSSFHMIEHLTLSELYDFFTECHRVLKKGGLLILVTPNPENILVATQLFYMDPTHRKPIPKELLEFYMTEWGFEVWKSLKQRSLEYFPYDYNTDDPMRHVAFRFNMEQEYSVWAVKK